MKQQFVRAGRVVAGLSMAAGMLVACSSTSHKTSSATTASQGNTGAAPGTSAQGNSTPTSAAANGTPIKIGFIGSTTGPQVETAAGMQYGAEAAVDALNAAGGIDGHPVKLYEANDASTSTGNLTAAQQLVETDHVTAVIDDGGYAFGAAPFLHSKGIPTAGAEVDGPEWQQDSNMFTITPGTIGPINGTLYTYNLDVPIYQANHVTKVAQYGPSFPSVINGLKVQSKLQSDVGISTCYTIDSYPIGGAGVNWTTVALQIKSAGCDGLYGSDQIGGTTKIMTALQNAGVHLFAINAVTYAQSILDSPSELQLLDGSYTLSDWSFSPPTGPAAVMIQNLKKYTPFAGQIPNYNLVVAYASAQLLFQGFQMAGANATPQQLISALHTIGNFNAGGLLTESVSFQNQGTLANLPKTECEYLIKVTATGYQVANGGKVTCGNLVS